MTVRSPRGERVCLLVLRCSVEECAPETLRIRTTFYPELATGMGEVRCFAAVDSATAAVAEALDAFLARASAATPHRPEGA